MVRTLTEVVDQLGRVYCAGGVVDSYIYIVKKILVLRHMLDRATAPKTGCGNSGTDSACKYFGNVSHQTIIYK